MNDDFEEWWTKLKPALEQEELTKALCNVSWNNGSFSSGVKLFNIMEILDSRETDDNGNQEAIKKIEELLYDK